MEYHPQTYRSIMRVFTANHTMSHKHHQHHAPNNRRVLLQALTIAFVFMLLEIIGGLWTNSLALLSDAGHMFSDSFSLLLSYLAIGIAAKSADQSHSFGYRRFEILAAGINGLSLLLIAALITYEAIKRLFTPPDVQSLGMLTISLAGLAANALQAWIMTKNGSHHHNLNMKSAYLHVLSDLLGSIAAIIAALLILLFGWQWADTLASLIITFLITRSAWKLCQTVWQILMEGVPHHIDFNEIVETILATEGVKATHDIHIWTLSDGFNAMSAHIVVDEALRIRDTEPLIKKIETALRAHNITHTTIQIESDGHSHSSHLLCQCHLSHH